MPFEVTDNVTGRIATFEKQPNEQDINEAFGLTQPQLKTGEVSKSPQKLTTGQKIYRAIEPYYEPILEAGALTGGAIVGAPIAPPFGSVAGAGLLYSGAKRLEKGIETAIGLGKPETIPEAFRETGKEVITGTELEMGGQIGGKVITGIAGKVLAPEAKRMTPEAIERLRLIKQAGIEVTPAEITQSKPLSLVESLLDKIAFSAGKIQDKRLLQLKNLTDWRQRILDKGGSSEGIEKVGLKIQEQLDDYLRTLTSERIDITDEMKNMLLKKLGTSETFESLGLGAKEALKKYSQAWQTKGAELFAKVGESIPKDTLIETANLQNTAFSLLKQQLKLKPALRNNTLINELMDLSGLDNKTLLLINQLPEAQSKQMLAQLKPKYDWEGLQLTVQKINDLIQSSDVAIKGGQAGVKGLSSTEGGIYKLLKKSAIQDINTFAETTGGNIKQDLQIANEFWGQGKNVYNSPIIKRLLRTNPEKIVDAVVKPNSVSDIKLFKQAVGNEGFNNLKQGFSKKLLNSFADGKSFIKSLTNYGDETLTQLYSPQELQQLKQLGNLDIEMNKNLVGNPFFRSLVRTAPEKVVSFIVKPNNTTNIDLVEKIVGKEGVKEIASKHLENVMALNKYELFSPEKFVTQLKKYGDNTMSRLLQPDVWQELKNLGKVSQIARGAEALAGNPSGTAQNLITFVIGGMVLKDPINKSWLIIAPNILAKAYLSKLSMRYLTTGFKMPANSKEAISLFTKLVSVFGKSNLQRVNEQNRMSMGEIQQLQGTDTRR